jgi:ABC-type polar amino acid transport system ATPase subunit
MAEEKITQQRLSVEGLKCANGKLLVLNDFALKVAAGETFAIVGRSGGGKSTFLRCLSLLQQPEAGNAFLDGSQYLEQGQSLLPPWQIRKQIVMVFQNYNLFPNMTAMRNITLALEKVIGIDRNQAEERASAVATKLGIAEVLDRYPDSLSGGQAQRLALARAMVLEPKVLLLDEITSGLDPETIINVVEAITELRNADLSGSLSIVLVTHLMHFAADFADRIGFIHNGKIHEELPAKSFFQDCKLPETKAFVSAFATSL